MRKKAQGLSINAIIVAVIALVVLVVLVAIFTGRLGIFSKSVSELTSCSQICSAKGYDSGQPEGTSGFDSANSDTPLGARDSEGRQCYCQPQK
jgi:hypothetical protein